MAEANLSKFDPEACPQGAYEGFCEFVEQFCYEYEAVAKEPPKDTTDKEAWIEQNKRKLFLGKYSSRALQKEYEDCTTEEERKAMPYSGMVDKLKTRFKSASNTTLANFKFHKLSQNSDESFDAFAIRVKREAVNCDFTCNAACKVRDIMIRDQIVIGTSDDEVRRHALKDQWDLAKLISQGRSLESATKSACIIKKEEVTYESNVNRTRPGKYSKRNVKNSRDHKERETSVKSNCYTCSSKTCKGKKSCPAYEMTCFLCNKKGHFRGAKACKNKTAGKSRRLESDTESSDTDDSTSSTPEQSSSESEEERRVKFFKNKRVTKIRRMRRIHKKRIQPNRPRYVVDVIIKEQEIEVFADTGADINIMSKKVAQGLELPIEKTKMKIKPYGSKKLKCCGVYTGTVMYGENVANTDFYIIDQEVETLLSGRVAEDLNIIEYNPVPIRKVQVADKLKSEIADAYPKVFTGVGTLKDYKVKFFIDHDVKPVAQPARPIPFHLRKKFEREIDKMEKDGIIEEHIGPAPWISNVVLSPKDDGQTRVTVDMRLANKAIKATNIPIPRIEEITSQLAGNTCFSKLDFKSAFHQLEIEEESRSLTVFHAGKRLMRYKKLTMGTKPASGELNKALAPLFQDVEHAQIIHDDLIIATPSLEEHMEVLHRCLKIIEESGTTLNLEKCHFAKDEIPFWGMLINGEGLKPDPEKVKALHLASRPKSKEELISFLCMVQSNKEFIESIAQKTTNLRKLTKKSAQFKWDVNCEKEYKDLKSSFSDDILLRHFNPNAQSYIAVDAHKHGLSAILLQGNTLEEAKPVFMASRATTPVESRYAQLDLEALSIDYALRRFRYYLIGGPTTKIITDHKPLVSIFSNVRKGSIRIDRIKLRHQDIDFEVSWRKGKDNPADYLSRHAVPLDRLPKHIKKETGELEKTIWFLQYSPYTEAVSIEKIIKETEKDDNLVALKDRIKKGYIPKECKELIPFRKIFNQLTITDDGLILKDEKIVLPKSLQAIALKKAHQGSHPGMNNLKRRIRSHFWMPKLNEAVEKLVKACNECLLFGSKNTKEPLSAHKVPQKAWSEVNIDLFGPMPNKKHILVVTDSMSRFPAAKVVPSTSSAAVVPSLDQIYSDFGQPDMHRTDNGPPFNSTEFKNYSKGKGIEHVKTFPYHPQANPAETFMKPLGKAMKAAFHSKQDPGHALNELLGDYRATPHPATGNAPGSIMFRHGYGREFPRVEISDDQVKQGREEDVAKKTQRQENLNKSNHRMKSNLKVGDQVYLKNKQRSKFEPLFGPDVHEVIDKGYGGVITQSKESEAISRRHLDDVKQVPSTDDFSTGLNALFEEEELNDQPDEPPPVETEPTEVQALPRRSARERRPNPKYDDFVRR